jgi:hypothetical protein
MSASSGVEMVLCENIMRKSLDDIRQSLFGLLENHQSLVELHNAEYVRLVGVYAAQYQYGSELYVHCISLVRKYKRDKNTTLSNEAIDRRDMLEQYLKAVKMNYDALSRKVTIFTEESRL